MPLYACAYTYKHTYDHPHSFSSRLSHFHYAFLMERGFRLECTICLHKHANPNTLRLYKMNISIHKYMNSHLPPISCKHPTAPNHLNYITYFMILMKVSTLFGTRVQTHTPKHTHKITLYAKYRWKFRSLVLKFLPTSFIDFVSVLCRPFIYLLHKWHHRSCEFWARYVYVSSHSYWKRTAFG